MDSCCNCKVGFACRFHHAKGRVKCIYKSHRVKYYFYSIINNVVYISVMCVSCRAAFHQMWHASVTADATEVSKHYRLAVIWAAALGCPTIIEHIFTMTAALHANVDAWGQCWCMHANIDPCTSVLHAFHCYTKTSLPWTHAGLWFTDILMKLKLH